MKYRIHKYENNFYVECRVWLFFWVPVAIKNETGILCIPLYKTVEEAQESIK